MHTKALISVNWLSWLAIIAAQIEKKINKITRKSMKENETTKHFDYFTENLIRRHYNIEIK